MARKPQYRWPWPKIRLEILERDGHLCQIRGPHCTVEATTVDHRVALSRGGAWFDYDNLRASCARCNYELARAAHRPRNRPSRNW